MTIPKSDWPSDVPYLDPSECTTYISEDHNKGCILEWLSRTFPDHKSFSYALRQAIVITPGCLTSGDLIRWNDQEATPRRIAKLFNTTMQMLGYSEDVD